MPAEMHFAGYRDSHLRLWTDLVGRAQPGYLAAPATLLAFTAGSAATAPWPPAPRRPWPSSR